MTTSSKTVIGAINELDNDMANKQDKLINPLTRSNIVNNLTSTSATNVLSAYQGKVLNDTKQSKISIVSGTPSASSLSTNFEQRFNEIKFTYNCQCILGLHLTYNGQDSYTVDIIDYDEEDREIFYDAYTTYKNGYSSHNTLHTFRAAINHRYLIRVKRTGNVGTLVTDGTASHFYAIGIS